MTMAEVVGVPTGGKAINLGQLQAELVIAGLTLNGLGLAGDQVYTYDASGEMADFAPADQPTVDQVIAAHVAMRDTTDAEYSAEFQTPGTTVERKQEIRDIMAGLLPREQVPMEAQRGSEP
jgi:hypothetical protein